MRSDDFHYKGVGAEFKNISLSENIELFKFLYQGRYNLDIYLLPEIKTTIPIAKNTLYSVDSEKTLLKCIEALMENHEQEKKPKGEVFKEDTMNIGQF